MQNAGAHPRSRGENRWFAAIPGYDVGSSPLTRGKHPLSVCHVVPFGLIPAHAGKTDDTGDLELHLGAHPRSRGENSKTVNRTAIARGSSPLTRGKQDATASWSCPSGLIPAHAGKTVSSFSYYQQAWAHPRSRGENTTGNQDAITRAGSSPLTRGKRQHRRQGRRARRLIPAHAGKTRLMGEACGR